MNTEEWHADIPLTDTTVKHCLETQFPFLAPFTEIRLIGEGWDNKAFLVNKQIIFRFPKRQIAVKLIQQENQLLHNLKSLLSIAIPVPEYIGHPMPDYPYEFQGYKIISGKSAYHAQLTLHDRVASLPTFAHFLKQLHSINETHAQRLGAKPQIFNRTEINKLLITLNERVNKITFIKINQAVFQHEIHKVQKLTLDFTHKCLVHGDLDCRHLIFNNHQLTGIIDWGDAGINHKAVDLALIWSFYPPEYHNEFFTHYGDVDPNTWNYARFLGLYTGFTHLLYGNDIQDTLLIKESIDTIKRINADLLLC